MARPVLPTDFKDDILAESMSGKRRYRIIQNADGTVSLDDVTDYEQVGSTFGAKQVNDMSSAVNSIEDVKAANNCTTTEPGFVLDARQGKTLMDKSNELSRDLNAINDNGAIKGMDAREDGVYITYSTGADTVTKKLGSFQRKLLGRVTSSTTFDCKSIPGWEDFTENNFAIIPVKIDATGGQWKNGATGAGGAQQGGCTPTLSYDKVNGILKVSNFSWNNDYAYGSYWTNYCHGNMTADVYCYHF